MPRLPLAALLMAAPLAAQVPGAAHVEVATVAARPGDVGSLDSIIRVFYEVVSGPAGAPRQWSRDRSLYIADLRFVALAEDSGRVRADVMSHQDFVDRTDAAFRRRGFYEREIHRVTHRFGHLAHVFSTYDIRQREDGPVIGRGINSIQLFWDGTRWWIANVVWDDERPDNPIPPEYLPEP